MARFLAQLGLAVSLAVAGTAALAGEVTVLGGAPAHSALALPDSGGRVHVLDDYRGRVVLVNFWASWCPPCLKEFPSLETLSRELEGRPFDILAVNVAEGAGILHRFLGLQESGIRLLADRDGAEARAWQAEFFPTSYIVGPDGALEYQVVGEADWNGVEPRAWIDALMPDR